MNVHELYILKPGKLEPTESSNIGNHASPQGIGQTQLDALEDKAALVRLVLCDLDRQLAAIRTPWRELR